MKVENGQTICTLWHMATFLDLLFMKAQNFVAHKKTPVVIKSNALN